MGAHIEFPKRYQVFLSSTYRDLQKERQIIIQALLQRKWFPVAMEHFPNTYETQLEFIRPLIKSSDYFICLIGSRYGEETNEGISYTHHEFNYAVRCGTPFVVFHRDKLRALPLDCDEKTRESRRKLEEFIKIATTNRIAFPWKTKRDLEGCVRNALDHLEVSHPRPGWISATQIKTEHTKAIRTLKRQSNSIKSQCLLSRDNFYYSYERAGTDITTAYNAAAAQCAMSDKALKIRLLGVCLRFSHSSLFDFIEKLKEDVHLDIDIAILAKNGATLRRLDMRNWLSYYRALEIALKDLKKNIDSGTLQRRISLRMHEYDHMPNCHGIMVNEEEVFIGHCAWRKDGRFTVGHNSYERYKRKASDFDDARVDYYSSWFSYCVKAARKRKSSFSVISVRR